RAGLCDLDASARALMLRSRGGPARLVKGFLGAENAGDGTYAVVQSQAHSWVEVLVPARDPRRAPASDWLAVDPTPSGEAPAPGPWSLAGLWQDTTPSDYRLWGDVVGGSTAERQAALFGRLSMPRGLGAALAALMRGWWALFALAPLLYLGARLAGRLRHSGGPRRRPAAGLELYGR